MQFFKKIDINNKKYNPNGVHSWLWSGQENKIDLGIYFEKFLFSKHIHITQRKNFSKTNKNCISDTAASIIRKLYEKGFFHDRLVQDGLNCCQSIVFNRGYKNFVIDFESFKKLRGDDSVQNIMIIPGCQHPGMLKGRIKKAVKSIQYFDKNLKIVASGCNPLENPTGPEKVTIPDESKFILNYLNDLIIDQRIITPPVFEKIEENESFNTTSNLTKALSKLDKKQSHNLIIVSSTFHLIKLAKFVEEVLTEFYNEHSNSEDFIKNIFLFGAEKEDAALTPSKSSGYIKSMFVDIFDELIRFQTIEDQKVEIRKHLEINGYCVIKDGGLSAINLVSQALGEIIQQKDISIEDEPKKWVNSSKEMPFHTDHSSADFVAWHCIEQTDIGGESLLSDISVAFSLLSDLQKELLKKIQIKNVQLFDGDLEFHPLINIKDEHVEFYFVPWLVQDDICDDTQNALKEIESTLQSMAIKILLAKGDVLVINNKKLVHGRDALLGSPNRFLKRYWIKSNKK
jgi:hypothetical protein